MKSCCSRLKLRRRQGGKRGAGLYIAPFGGQFQLQQDKREILKMLTTNPAALMGLSGQRGALAPGLAADLIATPQNPFDDIWALRDVRCVMKDGRVFRDDR